MVEGWPTIGPSLGPPRCNSEEPDRSHQTQRREKESPETGQIIARLIYFLVDTGLDIVFHVAQPLKIRLTKPSRLGRLLLEVFVDQ